MIPACARRRPSLSSEQMDSCLRRNDGIDSTFVSLRRQGSTFASEQKDSCLRRNDGIDSTFVSPAQAGVHLCFKADGFLPSQE
jgi:hypothetical protein